MKGWRVESSSVESAYEACELTEVFVSVYTIYSAFFYISFFYHLLLFAPFYSTIHRHGSQTMLHPVFSHIFLSKCGDPRWPHHCTRVNELARKLRPSGSNDGDKAASFAAKDDVEHRNLHLSLLSCARKTDRERGRERCKVAAGTRARTLKFTLRLGLLA